MFGRSADLDRCDWVVDSELTGGDRWLAYHRMQELGLPCACWPHQALKIGYRSPLDIVQSWSVARSLTWSPGELIATLEMCLQLTEESAQYCYG